MVSSVDNTKLDQQVVHAVSVTPSDGTKMAPTPGSRKYAIICCIFASLCGLFFGYDQGVTGGCLVMPSFLKDFCIQEDYGKFGFQITSKEHAESLDLKKDGSNSTDQTCFASADKYPSEWITFTTLFNTLYNIGCIIGAFSAGYIADYFGRKKTVFASGLMFVSGTFWVIFTPERQHACALAGRVLEGMGVGTASFISPVYAAEMAPKELRGMLAGFMQMTIVTGLLLAGIVNIIVEEKENGWRITNGVAVSAPIIVMIGIWFVPESPRWVYKRHGRETAQTTLQNLRKTEDVDVELNAIGDQLEEEGYEQSTWSDLWVNHSIRRRLLIAMFLHVLQQATGINPMFTYGGQIFESVVGKGVLSLLILQIVNFVSTIPAMYWVDRYGRRSLLLIGACGMVAGHVLSGILYTTGCETDKDGKNKCESTQGWLIIVFTAFFIFNFAISWGPICWIYPAEIFPTHVRAKAVSLSTMTNWTMGTLMTWIPKLFPHLGINGVFFLFAALCGGAGVFVYFKCPETKGLMLEEVEALFHVVKAGGVEEGEYNKSVTPVQKQLE